MYADENVIKIKHDVLYTVAKLAFEGRLEEERDHIATELIPGPTPQFRCCIYKEREIIRQRVRLAEGKAPGAEDDGNVIQVISSACEDCPISSYTVTENCQNCLGKACVNACKFGAIEPGRDRSHIDPSKCKECGRCAQACPYNAIAHLKRPCKFSCPVNAITYNEYGISVIDKEKCIRCGKCIHSCPFGAIGSKSFIVDVINALREGKKSPAARAAALRNGKNPNEDDNPPEQRVAQPSTVREENGDRTNPDTGEIPVVQKDDGRISADPNDPEVAKAIRNEHIEQRKTKRTRTRRNRVIAIIVTIVVLLGLAGGAFATYRWSQTKYYIGDYNGEVAIFQGVPTSLFGFQLSHAVTDTHMKTSELPPSWQEQLAQGISFDTYGEAKTHTRLIKKQLKQQQDEAAQKEQDKANGESDNKSSGTTSDKSSGKSDKSDDASANKSGGDQS